MTAMIDTSPVVENIDDVIMQIFEESDDDSNAIFFPVTTQKQARAFVKALHAKGVSYGTICEEIVEFEQNFTSWRTGIGRPGIGNRVIERINRPVMEILLFELTEDDVKLLAADLQTAPAAAATAEQTKEVVHQVASHEASLVADQPASVHNAECVNGRLSASPELEHLEDAIDGCAVSSAATGCRSAESVAASDDVHQVVPEAKKVEVESDRSSDSDELSSESPVLANGLQSTLVSDDSVNGSTTERELVSVEVSDKTAPLATTSIESPTGVSQTTTDEKLAERLTENSKDNGKPEIVAVDNGAAQRSHENGSSPSHNTEQSTENHVDGSTTDDVLVDLTNATTLASTDAAPPPADRPQQVEVTSNGTTTRLVGDESTKPEVQLLAKTTNGDERPSNGFDRSAPPKNVLTIDENYNSDDEESDESSSSRSTSQLQTLNASAGGKSIQGDGPGYVYAFTDTSMDSQSSATGNYRIKIGASRHPYSRLRQAALFNVDIRLVSAVNVSSRLAASRAVVDELGDMALPDTAGWFVGPLDVILDALMTVSRQFPVHTDSDC